MLALENKKINTIRLEIALVTLTNKLTPKEVMHKKDKECQLKKELNSTLTSQVDIKEVFLKKEKELLEDLFMDHLQDLLEDSMILWFTLKKLINILINNMLQTKWPKILVCIKTNQENPLPEDGLLFKPPSIMTISNLTTINMVSDLLEIC